MSEGREGPRGRGRPERLGDLLPAAARGLGLEEELRLARAVSTWEAIVGERVPMAAGQTRLVAVEAATLLVEVASPIVGQEMRLRAIELLTAFRSAPGGTPARALRVRVRPT